MGGKQVILEFFARQIFDSTRNHFWEMKKMNSQLKSMKLMIKEIEGDGNCLFRALSHQLTTLSARISHSELRMEIVNYIKSNEPEFKSFLDQDLDEYLSQMSTDGCFGGHLELVACSKLYNCTILIHQLGQKVWKIETSGSKIELNIVYHDHEHYSSTTSICKVARIEQPKKNRGKNSKRNKTKKRATGLEQDLEQLSI